MNFNWISTDTGSNSIDGYGIASAAHFVITDSTGIAGRFEYMSLEDDDFGSDLTIWGLTGTLDHKLTGGLTLRGEVRYDSATDAELLTGFGDDIYFGDDGPGDDDSQVTAGVEVIYGF